ncbi:hypothetical protein, partial [Bradyrhizobium liaoningense]|uniref:hypothetical protein n=1 Tax=Bradyrhizobium liaoningense TaxID=43992 RepID=UPI0024E0B785
MIAKKIVSAAGVSRAMSGSESAQRASRRALQISMFEIQACAAWSQFHRIITTSVRKRTDSPVLIDHSRRRYGGERFIRAASPRQEQGQSYAGFWVTRRSGGVVFRHLDDLDAVFESDTCADLRQL